MECISNLLHEFLGDKIFIEGAGINITASFVGESRTFFAHEHILSTNSPVFSAMLNTNCKETANGVIEINDFAPSIVEKMIRFCYTKYANVNNLDDAIALLKISDKYLMNELKLKCLEILEKYLHEQNVFTIYQVLEANFTDTTAFKNCKKLISSFFIAFIMFDEFLQLDEKLVKDILSWRILNVQSEYDIYRAAVRWAIHKCVEKKLCLCEEHLVSAGSSLFTCVQYDRLSSVELENVLPSVRNVAQNTEKFGRHTVDYDDILASMDKISCHNWILFNPCSISAEQSYLSFRPIQSKIFLSGFRALLRGKNSGCSTFSLYCDKKLITSCDVKITYEGSNYKSYPIILPTPIELQRDKLFFVFCSTSITLDTFKLEKVFKSTEMFEIHGDIIAIHSMHFIVEGFHKVSILSN